MAEREHDHTKYGFAVAPIPLLMDERLDDKDLRLWCVLYALTNLGKGTCALPAEILGRYTRLNRVNSSLRLKKLVDLGLVEELGTRGPNIKVRALRRLDQVYSQDQLRAGLWVEKPAADDPDGCIAGGTGTVLPAEHQLYRQQNPCIEEQENSETVPPSEERAAPTPGSWLDRARAQEENARKRVQDSVSRRRTRAETRVQPSAFPDGEPRAAKPIKRLGIGRGAEIWARVFRERWPQEVVSRPMLVEMRWFKDMIGQYGDQVFESMVRLVVLDYEAFSERFKHPPSRPTPKMLYLHRDDLKGRVADGRGITTRGNRVSEAQKVMAPPPKSELRLRLEQEFGVLPDEFVDDEAKLLKYFLEARADPDWASGKSHPRRGPTLDKSSSG